MSLDCLSFDNDVSFARPLHATFGSVQDVVSVTDTDLTRLLFSALASWTWLIQAGQTHRLLFCTLHAKERGSDLDCTGDTVPFTSFVPFLDLMQSFQLSSKVKKDRFNIALCSLQRSSWERIHLADSFASSFAELAFSSDCSETDNIESANSFWKLFLLEPIFSLSRTVQDLSSSSLFTFWGSFSPSWFFTSELRRRIVHTVCMHWSLPAPSFSYSDSFAWSPSRIRGTSACSSGKTTSCGFRWQGDKLHSRNSCVQRELCLLVREISTLHSELWRSESSCCSGHSA